MLSLSQIFKLYFRILKEMFSSSAFKSIFKKFFYEIFESFIQKKVYTNFIFENKKEAFTPITPIIENKKETIIEENNQEKEKNTVLITEEEKIQSSNIENLEWICYTEKNIYLSQRDNVYAPHASCNVTSMIIALYNSNYDYLIPTKKGIQPEDDLYNFLNSNDKVLEFYKNRYPILYYQWVNNKNNLNSYPPNEVHEVLAYGTNLWLNKEVVVFKTDWKIIDLFNHIINTKKSIIQSVFWNKYNHVVVVQGLKGKNNISAENVTHVIIDDPYGNPYTNWVSYDGNDISIDIKDYYIFFKPINDKIYKWAHVII